MKKFYVKKWTLFFAGAAFFVYSNICLGQVDTDEKYLGQNPPGMEPEIFAPDIISLDNRLETYPTFSPDGKELFFTVVNSSWTTGEIYYTREQDGTWNEPEIASFSDNSHINWESFISPDGTRQFFASSRPPSAGMDIWMVDRLTDTTWSDPVQLDINSSAVDGSPCITNTNSLYFKSRRSGGVGGSWLYKTEFTDSLYTQVESLGSIISTGSGESEPYMAPDESYLIFISNSRTGGNGGWDLWITFHNDDDSWTEPVNMGSDINTSVDEYGPRVSHDGNYLFFTKDIGGSDMDIYWVSASIIDTIKANLNTNTNLINLTYEDDIQVFPNPSNGIVSISIDDLSGKLARFEVVNNLGKQILVSTFQNMAIIDLSDYPKGIYFIRFLIDEQVINKKICLE